MRQTLCLIFAANVLALLSLLLPCSAQPPEPSEADRTSKESRARLYDELFQVTFALRKFDDKHGHLPSRAMRSADGKPALSWRVALLPFLGEEELHEQFRLDEAWDSEHNRKLIPRMPDVFAVTTGEGPAPDASAGNTRIVLPLIEGSLWHGDDSRRPRIKDVTDGTAYTMGLIVAPSGKDVSWTKPEDFPMQAPHEMFGDRDYCVVTTLDAARHRISKRASKSDLYSLLTYDAADVVDWKKLYGLSEER